MSPVVWAALVDPPFRRAHRLRSPRQPTSGRTRSPRFCCAQPARRGSPGDGPVTISFSGRLGRGLEPGPRTWIRSAPAGEVSTFESDFWSTRPGSLGFNRMATTWHGSYVGSCRPAAPLMRRCRDLCEVGRAPLPLRRRLGLVARSHNGHRAQAFVSVLWSR